MSDPMFPLDIAESISVAEFGQVLEIALGCRFFRHRRVGEDGVDVQEPALLHLPDSHEQPRFEAFRLHC